MQLCVRTVHSTYVDGFASKVLGYAIISTRIKSARISVGLGGFDDGINRSFNLGEEHPLFVSELIAANPSRCFCVWRAFEEKGGVGGGG